MAYPHMIVAFGRTPGSYVIMYGNVFVAKMAPNSVVKELESAGATLELLKLDWLR